MRKFTLIIGLLFSALNVHAQQKELDSLLHALQLHRDEDTARLALFIEASYDYSFTDPRKGLATADSAAKLAEKLQERSSLASAYNYKALNYSALGEDSLALAEYNRGIALRKELKDSAGLARMYHNAGISYFNLSDYTQALAYQEEALAIFDRLSHDRGIAATNNSIGVIYLLLADYPKALQHYFTSLKIFEKLKDTGNEGQVYTNIGLVYYHMEDYKKALEYHFKSLEISRQNGDRYSMQNTLGNIGETYDDMGDAERSLQYYHEALAINREMGNNRGLANDMVNAGIVFYSMPRYDSAFYYLQHAARLYEQLGDKHGLANALTYLSGLYQKAPPAALVGLGIAPARRYQQALSVQEKALALSRQTGNLADQGDAWGNLSDIYAAQHDYKAALEAYRHHILLSDSVVNDEKKSEITRMGMQYEFDKKEAVAKAEQEKQKALSAAELNKQRIIRNFIIGAAVVLLLAACVVFVFYSRKRNAEAQSREAAFRTQVAETEMKALRMQMNPHFIFNSLGSISDYIAKNDTEAADFYLARFSKIMRLILESSDKKLISLADDLKILEGYMQLEVLRLDRKFSYEITVDEQIDADNTLVPPLILQPFVENSIWHGLSRKSAPGRIRIDVKKEGEAILCTVEDNGVGRKMTMAAAVANGKEQHRSMGMKITRERVEIINKMKRKELSSVELIDLDEGLRVEIRLPFEAAF